MNASTYATERPGDQRVGERGAQCLVRAGQAISGSGRGGFGGTTQALLEPIDTMRGHAISRSQVIRLAVVRDYALVSAGVAAMLADARIDVVRTEAPPTDRDEIDIALYDPCGPDRIADADGSGIWTGGPHAKVVIYSWDIQPEVARRAVLQGAAGCLSKSLPGPVLAAALERIMLGEIVVVAENGGQAGDGVHESPMPTENLSPRETEVLTLIAGGLTNHQIAGRLYVSINSVKAYIRSAYRKIGVERRTQAVLWGVRHGLSWDGDVEDNDRHSAEATHPAGTQWGAPWMPS